MPDLLAFVLTYVLPLAVVLGVVVTVHELGHFWTARACGVAIERFSIGFGRAIFSRTDRSGVEWRVGWIPLGGYVMFAGDANAASVTLEEKERLRTRIRAQEGVGAEAKYLPFKPLWQRALITAAGPAANFILAVALFAAVFMALGEVRQTAPRVGSVFPNSPAAAAGLRPGDLIVKVQGRTVRDFDQMARLVLLRSGEPVRLVVERGPQTLELSVTPQRQRTIDPLSGRSYGVGFIGIGSSTAKVDQRRFRYDVFTATGAGVDQTLMIVDTSLTYLRRIVTGRESGDQLGGPIGMGQRLGKITTLSTADAPDFGVMARTLLLNLAGMTAVISTAIGFMNLLPVPVLDGGHLVFYAYEAVARRPVGAAVQAAGYRVGLALLAGLMLFATWNDLQNLRLGSFLGGLFS